MSKTDLLNLDGTVCDIQGGGVYSITLENGAHATGKLCGKMKKFKIRVVIGDKVTLSLSPYDTSHGLITLRHKTK